MFYSLGNFVSNQRKRYCDGGLMAEITLTLHPDGHITYASEAIPVWVALPDYRILPVDVADTMELSDAYTTFSHRRSRTSRIVRKDLLIIGIALSYRNREIRPYS